MSIAIPKPIKLPLIEEYFQKISLDGTNLLFSKEEAKKLSMLKLGKDPMFTFKERYFLYEMINMFKKLKDKHNDDGFDIGFNYLNSEWEKIYNGDYRRTIIFQSPVLTSAENKFKVDIMIYNTKVVPEKGIYTCKNPKCKSDQTISVEKQIRSADEPADIFVTCVKCGYHFKSDN